MAEDPNVQRFLAMPAPSREVRMEPAAEGLAFRFAIILPVLSGRREVFTADDQRLLQLLLTEDLGGCTYTPTVTHPLLEGTWQDDDGSPVRDKHAQYVVYATQTEESEQYFANLQRRLQEHGAQQKVLVEQTTVRLL